MKRSLSNLLIPALMIILCTSFAVQSDVSAQDKAAEIDKLMQLYYDYGQFNGTVLVAEDGNVIFKKGYGLANMEWNIANEPDTKFRIGSITKQFTSMIIMQLVEEGKMKLDAKMTEYLPGYRKDTGDRVTIHHLLTHTSGIPSYTSRPDFFEEYSRDPYTVDAFVKQFCSGDLEFEPGSRFAYNNSGYFLLGAVIEKVTDKAYKEVLKERILDPAGMMNTGYDLHEPIIKNRASGYEKTFSGYENTPYLNMLLPYAAGAMFSTVEDLYVWDQILYANKLLPKKYKTIMFKPFLSNYAYGWMVREIKLPDSEHSLQAITHGGGINGFTTLITRLIDDKHVIVLFNNTGGTSLGQMSLGIIHILYGKSYDLPKKSIAEALYKTLAEKDIASVIRHYHELKEKYPDAYDFRETELNRLGYHLLAGDRADDAIEIFKLNVEVFSDKYNVYDSLAEAYMKKGEKDLAIKNYAISLEMNPKNANAIEMLKKMNEKE